MPNTRHDDSNHYYYYANDGLIFTEYRILTLHIVIGPSIDFKLRRTKLASDDLYKESCKIPREVKPLTKKNISKDAFGTKLGRIHMMKQDVARLQTRKMKGLKKTPEEKKQMLRKKKLARKQTTA